MIYVALYLGIISCQLIALTSILFTCKRRKYGDNAQFTSPSIHFKMVIIGVTAAPLVSEVMAKYTSPLHILLYVIWMYELKDLHANSPALIGKLFAKKPNLKISR